MIKKRKEGRPGTEGITDPVPDGTLYLHPGILVAPAIISAESDTSGILPEDLQGVSMCQPDRRF